MKKALSLILSLVMVLTLIPMAALPAFAEGETAVSNETVINVYDKVVPASDPTGVLFTSLFGSSNKMKANTTYMLQENIDLDGSGKNDGGSYVYFQDGTILDGNGYSITGIYLTGTSDRTLFYVNNDDITIAVRNISFGTKEDPVTFTPSGSTTSGTAKGFSLFWSTCGRTNLTFSNVTAHVNTTLKAGSWQEHSVFVARNWGNLTFENCATYGTIDQANGFVGSFVGGTYNGKIVFNNCENNIDYTNTGTQTIGGFVGYSVISNNSKPAVEINNCVNNGDITGGARQVGGFVGNFVSNGGTLTINNSVNYGTIDIVTGAGTHIIGQAGFVGTVGATGTAGNVLIANCVNEGNVTGDEACSGFVGTFKGTTVTVTKCENNGDIASAGRSSGAIARLYPNTVVTVDTFVNNGDIYSEWNHAGGVLGAVAASNESKNDVFNVVLNNVLNTAEVKSTYPGGISGNLPYANITINNCVNVGTLTSTATEKPCVYALINCQNEAVINSDSTADNINNLYTGTYTEGLLKQDQSKSVTLEESVAAINANTDMTSTFGRFAANAAGDNVVVSTPAFAGYQVGKVDADNKYTVRFLATINDVKLADPCEYAYLGMEFSFDGGETFVMEKTVAHVYTSVIATEDGAQVAKTAEALGGEYIYAVIGTGFDATKDLNLVVRTYAIDKNDVRIEGNKYAVSIPAQVK